MQTTHTDLRTQGRSHYVDWLRVLAMGGVFLFHCARFFDHEGWHVKNEQLSTGFTIFTGFFAQWGMPLFFLLAGFGTWHALRNRSSWQFIRTRFLRLFVPYSFGILLLIPPQKYLEARFFGRFAGSFLEFLPHYFGSQFLVLIPDLRLFGYWGYHLWFLAFLFIFSIIWLPLLQRVRARLVAYDAAGQASPRLLLAMAAPILVIQIALRPLFPDYLNWADTLHWSFFFLYGFLIASNRNLQQAIQRYAGAALISGIMAFAVIGIWFFAGDLLAVAREPAHSFKFVLLAALFSFNTWAWVVGLTGLAARRLNFSNELLRTSNEAVLPFYVLHQTVILLIGYYVVDLPTPTMVKFALIALLSFCTILVMLRAGMNNGFFRFMLGLKTAQPDRVRTKAARQRRAQRPVSQSLLNES